MQLQQIITQANAPYRLRFLAMYRSLRETGCQLPVKVLPYDDTRFDLPDGCEWWEVPTVLDWLRREKTHPGMYKYQCLLISNYQFVDCDIVFLTDPAKALEAHGGWVVACGHWHNPAQTVTPQSLAILSKASTVWQRSVFNAGQFACDRALYTEETLRETASRPDHLQTVIRHPFHEQPGLNLLVHLSGVPVTNLTLPPNQMQSTWAGDYLGDFEHYWTNEQTRPYLIHWAGCAMHPGRRIDELAYQFLSTNEQRQFKEDIAAKAAVASKKARSLRALARRVYRGWRAMREP